MKRRPIKGFISARDGASAVEFSLVLGPLLLVMFGIIEFGRLLWTREALQETAITASRCMGVVGTSCGTAGVYSSSSTTTYVQGVASNWGVTLPSTGITLNRAASCAGVAGFSSVSISYTFQTVVPLLFGSLNGGVPLTATACFPNNS